MFHSNEYHSTEINNGFQIAIHVTKALSCIHMNLTSNSLAALARSGERTTTQVSRFFSVRAVGATQMICAI